MSTRTVFISYKHEDRAKAQQFADAFRQLGWRVWWDPELRAGEVFDDTIQDALENASCVLVLWSLRSTASDYVKDEAAYALDQEKLIPIALERVELPFRFRRLHTADLRDWDGDLSNPTFQSLTHDIERFCGPRRPVTEIAPRETHTGLDGAEANIADASWIDRLPVCGKRCSNWVKGILVAIVATSVGLESYQHGFDPKLWDLLLISGVVAFSLGLQLAASMPSLFQRMIGRLTDADVLRLGPISADTFIAQINTRADRWARATGVLVAISIILAFVIASKVSDTDYAPWILGTLEAMGGYIAGTYLGRMAYYGQLGGELERLCRTSSNQLQIDPSHADGVSGLKPVGAYFLTQSLVAGIPAVFIAAWLLVFAIAPEVYPHWHSVYVGLLVLAVVIETAAFFLPLCSFHRLMKAKKQHLAQEADLLTRRIAKLEGASTQYGGDPASVQEEAEALHRRYRAIETMKTWPVDFTTKGQFFSLNTLLLTALVLNLFKDSELMNRVAPFIGGLF